MELKIYVEDFRKVTDWFQICQQLKVDITSTVITLKINEATGEQEQEEKVICEGCNREVPISDLSDVMEMYICKNCEQGEK